MSREDYENRKKQILYFSILGLQKSNKYKFLKNGEISKDFKISEIRRSTNNEEWSIIEDYLEEAVIYHAESTSSPAEVSLIIVEAIENFTEEYEKIHDAYINIDKLSLHNSPNNFLNFGFSYKFKPVGFNSMYNKNSIILRF